MQRPATIVHPEDIQRLPGSVRAAIETPASHYEEEFQLRHRDGTYRWVLIRATVLRDAAGTPQRMLGVHVDISERKQAEDAARHSARQVQALFEASVDVIGIMEVDGTFRDVSPSIRTLLGHEASELVGRNGFDFVHRDDRAALQVALARRIAQTGDRTSEACRLQRADGSWVYVESTLSNLLDDPDVRGLMTITRDVTERTRLYTELAALNHELESRVAERTRQLTEAQERLNLVIDIASDGFWDWNVTTGKVYYSPRWIELLGYDPQEVPPHVSFWEGLVADIDVVSAAGGCWKKESGRRVQTSLATEFAGQVARRSPEESVDCRGNSVAASKPARRRGIEFPGGVGAGYRSLHLVTAELTGGRLQPLSSM